MKHLQSFLRAARRVLPALIYGLAVQGTAFARPPQPKQPASNPGGSYVFSYAIVLLAVAVGLMLAFRPSHRRDRARPEQYDSAKTGLTDLDE